MWLKALQRGQFGVIWPSRVVSDKVQVAEVVASGVEILGVRIARVEMAKRNTLVAADVLNAEFAALFPHRIGQLLIVEKPTPLLGGIKGVKFQAGDFVLLLVHAQLVEGFAHAVVRRQAARQHNCRLRPGLTHFYLIFHRHHVLAAVVLAEAERIKYADGGIALLQNKFAVVLNGHVPGAIGQAEGFAELVQQLHEPHAALGGVFADFVVARTRTNVRVNVDDKVAAGARYLQIFFFRVDIGGLRLADFEELHAGYFVSGQHRRRKAQARLKERAPRHTSLGCVGVHLVGNARTHIAGQKQRGADFIGVAGVFRNVLQPLEVLQNIELHVCFLQNLRISMATHNLPH